jgi:hypothetical protein
VIPQLQRKAQLRYDPGYDLPYSPVYLATGKGPVLNEIVIQSAPIDETGDYARDGAVATARTVQIHRVAADSTRTATVYVLCAGPG